MPGWSTAFWCNMEKLIGGQSRRMAMFAGIVLRRREELGIDDS